MRIDFEWERADGVADVVLAATWARLRIFVGDDCVSEVLDSASHGRRSGTYGSLFPLAEWIVEHWWHLMYEPSPISPIVGGREAKAWVRDWVQRHNLLAAREGNALPDLTCVRDGDDIVIKWEEDPDFGTLQRVRFIGHGLRRIPIQTFRESLARFVNAVMVRLDSLGVANEDTERLRASWAALRDSERDEHDLCRSLSVLGLDPYDTDEVTEEIMETVQKSGTALPAVLRDDLLEGSSPALLGADFSWVEESRHRLAESMMAGAPRPTFQFEWRDTAHEVGYELARKARRETLGLDAHEPITEFQQVLFDRLGWSQDGELQEEAAPDTRLEALTGLQADHNRPVIVVPCMKKPEASRFRLARAAFYWISGTANESPRLLSAASTPIQRASRAFAAELLCPSSALAEKVSGSVSSEQIEELAAEFIVSPLLVAHQIENHELGHIEVY